jgi:hypothetical protein
MEEINNNNNNNNINSNNKIDNNNNNNFKDLIENEEDLKKINELFSPLSTPSEEFINAEVEKYIKLEEKKQNNEDNNNNKNNKKKNNKIIDHNLIDGLDDLDEIIELNYKGKEIDNNSIKNDNEIKRLFQIQELQLEKEIEKEMLETYKPELDPIDVKRADNLLKEDALIRLAVEQKIITREEVILFIDYYEINAKINKAKRITIERLKKLKELMTKNIKKNDENEEEEEEEEEEENEEKNIEEDQIEKLTNQIEKSLTVQNSILSQRFDFDKLLYHPGEFLTAVDIKAAKKTDSQNNNIVNKKIKEDNKNKIITKHTVIEDKNNKKNNNINSNNNLTKIYKDIINSSNKNTGNNFYSSRKNNQNYKENKIELYDDNANPTNLLKVRSDRREMVKLRMKKKGSKLKELFKFNPKMTREENQKLRENFMKMFEIPDSYLDKQNIDPMRKSFLRKKIEEARNYYKQ